MQTINLGLPGGSLLKCILYDSASNERFRSIVNPYLTSVHGCIVVYDVTSLRSFIDCKTYCKQTILEKCKKDVKIMLIGTKTDLEYARVIRKEEGLKFANENNYLFRETSCLNIASVIEAFETFIIETFNNVKNKNDLLLNKNK